MVRRYLIMFLLLASFLFARTRISMTLDANIAFDLSLLVYPAAIFPTYYFPTMASTVNPQGIFLQVGYQRLGPGGHTISNLFLTTRASGNFSPTVSLDQLYFAPDGEPLPPPGNDPPGGNWRTYSILYQTIEVFPVVGNQNFDRPQDFIFQAEPNDEPINSSVTIYYRVFGL